MASLTKLFKGELAVSLATAKSALTSYKNLGKTGQMANPDRFETSAVCDFFPHVPRKSACFPLPERSRRERETDPAACSLPFDSAQGKRLPFDCAQGTALREQKVAHDVRLKNAHCATGPLDSANRRSYY